MILMEKNAGITEGAEDKLQITFQKLMGSSCACYWHMTETSGIY